MSVGSADPLEFLASATEFANERLWGTLNAMLYVTPGTERDATFVEGARARDRGASLRHGGHQPLASAAYALATAPWGGHPSATLADVQSGLGLGAQLAAVRRERGREDRATRPAARLSSAPVFPWAPLAAPLGPRFGGFRGRARAPLGLAKVGYFAVRA